MRASVDVKELDQEEINLELLLAELDADPEIPKLLGLLQHSFEPKMAPNSGDIARKVSDASEQDYDLQPDRNSAEDAFSNSTARSDAEAREMDPLTIYHQKELAEALNGIVDHLRKNDSKRFVDLNNEELITLVLKGLQSQKFNPILPSPEVSPTQVAVLPGSGTIESLGLDKNAKTSSITESKQQPFSSKRTGKKRKPYKMNHRESWTQSTFSTKYTSTIVSGTILLNETEQKRNPLSPFKDRFIFVSVTEDSVADKHVVKEIELEAKQREQDEAYEERSVSPSPEIKDPVLWDEWEDMDASGCTLNPNLASMNGTLGIPNTSAKAISNEESAGITVSLADGASKPVALETDTPKNYNTFQSSFSLPLPTPEDCVHQGKIYDESDFDQVSLVEV